MKKKEGHSFGVWFSTLQALLLDEGITFQDEDSVKDDYENNRNVHDVSDEIVAEYG